MQPPNSGIIRHSNPIRRVGNIDNLSLAVIMSQPRMLPAVSCGVHQKNRSIRAAVRQIQPIHKNGLVLLNETQRRNPAEGTATPGSTSRALPFVNHIEQLLVDPFDDHQA
ncbi:MAG: hypothetical protein AAGB26_16835 [Planctomycetota bacterium]